MAPLNVRASRKGLYEDQEVEALLSGSVDLTQLRERTIREHNPVSEKCCCVYQSCNLFHGALYTLGGFVARRSCAVILLCLIITGMVSVGIKFINVETQPEALWVPAGSRALIEEDYFNAHFGAWWRMEQLIVMNRNEGEDTLTHEVLNEVLTLQESLTNIEVVVDGESVVLDDLCWKPIVHEGCAVTTPLGYWQSNRTLLNADNDIHFTVDQPLILNSIGMPMIQNTVLGGVVRNYTDSTIASANSLMIVYFVTPADDMLDKARAWEKRWLEIAAAADATYQHINVYRWAQRSIPDELARETDMDITPIIISYAVMFFYVAVALGRFDLIRSKFLVALSGIFVVICSIVISLGFGSGVGVMMTPIISEVIPFLILAIGVDNVFLLTQTFERTWTKPGWTVEDRMAYSVCHVGSSITLASCGEFLAFMLGVLTRMPAVQAFCYYAAFAVVADYFLQLTMFAAVLALNARRENQYRVELVPCIQLDRNSRFEEGDYEQLDVQNSYADTTPVQPKSTGIKYFLKRGEFVRRFFRRFYAPFVTKFVALKIIFIVLFLGLLGFSIFCITKLQIGLNQRTPLPSNDYIIQFFNRQEDYFTLGPNFYLVFKEYDFTSQANRDVVTSMVNTVNGDAQWVSQQMNSWLDAYTQWLAVCQDPDSPRSWPPPADKFYPWLWEFTQQDTCCEILPTVCGYTHAMDLNFDDTPERTLLASRMMSYYNPMWNTSFFMDGMASLRNITDGYEAQHDMQVFPYAIFYVFYEQYLFIREVAYQNTGVALAGILVALLIFLWNVPMVLIITITLAMIMADLAGMMYWANIKLNAISLVNLVMAAGISVEFCAHIARSFLITKGETRSDRVATALADVGASVFSGITVTKVLGVTVLAFVPSEIFEIYYFRMLMGTIVLGALHGLLWLPIVLSICGPHGEHNKPTLVDFVHGSDSPNADVFASKM